MKFDIEKFVISDFRINLYDKGRYYICAYYKGDSVYGDSVYLHKDGTLHDTCGVQNFYNKKEAQLHLEYVFRFSNPILISDEDLEIDI